MHSAKPFLWSEVIEHVKKTGIKRGRKYLDSLCAQDSLADSHYQILKLYDCILDTIQNLQYVLNPTTNVTEGDYTYQVWLPLLLKLFDIDAAESNVRLKVAESVADNSTIEKGDIYGDSSNVIGFKIDVRCLYDLPNHEVDVCSMEVCLPDADQKKFLGDFSKLLREGRLNTTSLMPLCLYSPVDKYTWVCQICGLQAFFSTVTYAGDDLFVAINQFAVAFPTCIDELQAFEESIQQLLYFKNDVESICESLKSGKNAIKMNNNVILRESTFGRSKIEILGNGAGALGASIL